ncbi:MAG TPA: peptidase M15, partial [Lachnospiraceae bacterium]|nr:peptidase M15 [Lachnospiraceae bacterium]
DTKIDAIFGAGTEEGVRKFQSKVGIEVDGMAGPETFEKIFKE